MSFSFILNYKIVSVFCYPLRFYHSLTLFLLSLYFPLFSSCFHPHFFSFMHFTPLFLQLFPSVLLLFYANFSLSAIAILPWGAGVFAFTPAKAFVRELKCPAITRLAGSITCRVTQFLRGSLLLLSLLLFAGRLTSRPRIDFTRDFVACPDNPSDTTIRKKPKAPAGRREPGQVYFFKAVTRKLENTVWPYFTGMPNNERAAVL